MIVMKTVILTVVVVGGEYDKVFDNNHEWCDDMLIIMIMMILMIGVTVIKIIVMFLVVMIVMFEWVAMHRKRHKETRYDGKSVHTCYLQKSLYYIIPSTFLCNYCVIITLAVIIRPPAVLIFPSKAATTLLSPQQGEKALCERWTADTVWVWYTVMILTVIIHTVWWYFRCVIISHLTVRVWCRGLLISSTHRTKLSFSV